MARSVLNKGTTANDGTGDTLRSAATKINDNFSELYSLLGGDSLSITSYLFLSDSGLGYNHVINSGFTTILQADSSAEKSIITIPAGTDTLVTLNSTGTLSNKTLTSPTINNPIIDGMQINDNDSSHQYTIVPGALTGDININLPGLTDSDTLVFQDQQQTLKNKTLDAPVIGTDIRDSSGNILIDLDGGNGARHVKISNSGTTPSISSAGTSPLNLNLNTTTTGAVVPDKLAYNAIALSPASDSDTSQATLVLMSGYTGTKTVGIDNGTAQGELKILVNNSSAVVTAEFPGFGASNTLRRGTFVQLKQYGSCQLIWDASNWHLISGGDSADALVTIG